MEKKQAGASYYELGKPNTLLINDGSVPVDANQTAEIVCSGNTIRSIKIRTTQTELQQFSLKPELLSNAIDKNREKRGVVTYQELPQVLIDAVLAAEDRRFFSHSGIDPIRILKALIVDVRERRHRPGRKHADAAVREKLLSDSGTHLARKFADAYMSILLEKTALKRADLRAVQQRGLSWPVGLIQHRGIRGSGGYIFRQKRLMDLTLGEAATLAGIITAPNRHTPLRYPDRATMRRNLVLDPMADYAMITPRERDDAKSKPLTVKPTSILNYSDAPYFVDYVQDQLIDKYGDEALARSRSSGSTQHSTRISSRQPSSPCSLGLKELDAYFAKRKQPVPPGTVQASLIAVDPKNGQHPCHDRRQELRSQPVQSHHAVETPAGKHFQTVRLCGSARNRLLQFNSLDSRLDRA